MDANSDGIFLTLLCDLHAAVCMKSNKIWSKGQSGRVGAPKMVGATNSGMVMVMVMVVEPKIAIGLAGHQGHQGWLGAQKMKGAPKIQDHYDSPLAHWSLTGLASCAFGWETQNIWHKNLLCLSLFVSGLFWSWDPFYSLLLMCLLRQFDCFSYFAFFSKQGRGLFLHFNNVSWLPSPGRDYDYRYFENLPARHVFRLLREHRVIFSVNTQLVIHWEPQNNRSGGGTLEAKMKTLTFFNVGRSSNIFILSLLLSLGAGK